MQTYNAILRGNEIEWLGQSPAARSMAKPMKVQVTILEEESERAQSNGQQISEILDRLSRLDPFKDIDDPVAWQRESRTDRAMPQ